MLYSIKKICVIIFCLLHPKKSTFLIRLYHTIFFFYPRNYISVERQRISFTDQRKYFDFGFEFSIENLLTVKGII